MRLAVAHARAMTIELLRYPAFLVPTLLFPPVFFLFFSTPTTPEAAAVRMATFAGFAALGVAFFQFGVGIASERASPWEAYLRTLPIGPVVRLGARVLSAAVFAVAAAVALIVVAVPVAHVSLSPSRWLALAIALLAGIAPFASLGIAIGYWAPERAALPFANLLYLGLSYAGGLWFRPGRLPHVVAAVSPYLPTRALSDALAKAVSDSAIAWRDWVIVYAFGVAFALLAGWGYQRDEGRRFR